MSSWPSSSTMDCALDVVVLDDQQPLGARGGEVLDPVERGFQALGGGRLDEVGEGAVRQAVLALFFQRDDLHRDVARGRVELELVEHRPAEHVGQEDIERDGRRAGTAGPATGPARPCVATMPLKPLSRAKPEQDARVVRVVLDDEQHGVARRRSRRGRPRCAPRARSAGRSARATWRLACSCWPASILALSGPV